MNDKAAKEQKPKKRSLREIFLEHSKPDSLGHTDWIAIDELVALDERFTLGNGGSWCRDDGPLKDYRIERKKQGNRIVKIRLTGKQEAPKERQINPAVRKAIIRQRCAVLDVGTNIECDHKNGRYDSHQMLDASKQKPEDFQPLSKAANTAKRQHCKDCKETGNRYDAKQLGYAVGWLGHGDQNFKQWGCGGCYWHDPKLFNATVSKNNGNSQSA